MSDIVCLAFPMVKYEWKSAVHQQSATNAVGVKCSQLMFLSAIFIIIFLKCAIKRG